MPSDGKTVQIESCVFSLNTCLPESFFNETTPHSAAHMFTHIAFVRPECGDCLIMALVTASGPSGLSAVLPREDQAFKPEVRNKAEWEREEPMLPLVANWREGDFTLAAVVRPGQDQWEGGHGGSEVKLREFCVKLLSRYTYSIGEQLFRPRHPSRSRVADPPKRPLLLISPSPDRRANCPESS
jgi:3-O-alpha-D-mannopyranosyl-alpha-D-mannopyranose xylosylphosphotransferase